MKIGKSRLQTFAASHTDVPIPAVFGPLACVSGTCRAFRACGWEDGHNFQRGNRIARLQQTEGVLVRLSPIPDLMKPLHTIHIFCTCQRHIPVFTVCDEIEVLTAEKHFHFMAT